MRSLTFHRGFLFAALLLSSLTSHGPFVVMAGILLLCACCLTAPDARQVLFSRRYMVFVSFTAAIITACYLWYLAVPHANSSQDLETSANNNFIFLMLVVLFLAAFAALIETRLDEITAMISALLVLHCAALLLQTGMLLATKQYIDFVKPITGEASRYLNYQSVNPIFAFRPTGLYVEPSTFGAAVGAMAVGCILLSRARGRTPSLLPISLTVAAMLITQSAAAVVQTGVLIVAVVIMHGRRAKAWGAVVLALLVLAAPGLISAYFDSFLLKFNADSGMRFALVSYIFDLRNGWDFVFGYGPFSLEYDLYNLASSGSGLPTVASLNDSGLLNFFIVKFGVAGLAIPAAIFLRMRKDVGSVCLFGLLMSTKLSYAMPVLYFGLLPLVMRLRTPLRVAATPVPSGPDDASRSNDPSRARLPINDNPWAPSP